MYRGCGRSSEPASESLIGLLRHKGMALARWFLIKRLQMELFLWPWTGMATSQESRAMIRLADVEDAAALDHSLGSWIGRPASCSMRWGATLKYRGQRQRLTMAAGQPACGCWCWPPGGAGFAVLIGGGLARNRPLRPGGDGLRSSARGQGWGERLLRTPDRECTGLRHQQTGAGVMAHNEVAHSLYRKCGFMDEGLRRQAYRLDEGYVDEISMGLLLPPTTP